jgi:hypothetical protein
VKLSRNSDGDGLKIGVENIDLRIGNWAANGNWPGGETSWGDFINAAANDRLGRTILINEPNFWRMLGPER